MDDPERRAQQCDIFHEDTLAFVEVHELGTKTILNAEDTFGGTLTFLIVHRNTIFSILQQTGPTTLVLGDSSFLGTETAVTAPGPPSVVRPTAIDGSLTCNSNILGLEGINAGREIETFQSFPRGFNDGVELGLEGKLQYGTFFNMQIYPTLQLNGSRQELLSSGDNHLSATFLRAQVDGLLNGLLVLSCCGIGLCAVLGDVVALLSKLRYTDALFYLSVLGLVPMGKGHRRKKQTEHQQGIQFLHKSYKNI